MGSHSRTQRSTDILPKSCSKTVLLPCTHLAGSAIFKIRAATLTVCNQSTSTAGSGQMETKGFPPLIFLQERHFGQELEKKVNRSPTTGRESRKENHLMSGIKAG